MKKHSIEPVFVNSEEEYFNVLKEYVKEKTKISYNCIECGNTYTISLVKSNLPLLCRTCKIHATLEQNYGSVENARKQITSKMNNTILEKYGSKDKLYQKIHEKSKETNLKKYGVENPMQDPLINKKAHDTIESRYGKRYYSQTDEYNDKIKETSIVKYGVEHFLQADSVKTKAVNTFLQKYGTVNPVQNESIQKKIEATNFERYGAPCVFCNESSIKPLINEIVKNKFEVDNVFQRKDIQDKSKSTCMKHYGVENFSKSIESRYNRKSTYVYDNISFDSSWELYFYVFHKDSGHMIKKSDRSINYTYNNVNHTYFPDFELNGELIEIKGDQFFKADGTMQNPYDHSLDGLFEAKHQCGLRNGVKFLRSSDLESIIKQVDSKYTHDFIKLFRTDLPFPYLNKSFKDKSDYGIIRHFHKSIYEANRNGYISPLQAWNDKRLIEKSALNRLKYVKRCKPSDVLQGFNVAKIAPKVSVFNPNNAAVLINKYLLSYDDIIDPFSGFSGRLLGAISCGKKYIGSDINQKHVMESNEIITYKCAGDKCTVSVSDLTIADVVEYKNAALFTCPPYGNKEQWGKDSDSFNKTCDEWIDLCIQKIKCDAYLFVVDATEKYKRYVVETLENQSHFGSNNELVIFIKP